MNLRTNIPHAPALQYRMGTAGTPSLEIDVDLSKYLTHDGKRSRYEPDDFDRMEKWIEAWLAEPNIRVALVNDRAVCVAADGATLTMQGEAKPEFQWLGGWIGSRVEVVHEGGKLRFHVAGRQPVAKEAASINPRVGGIQRYDLMPKAAVVSLCIQRGFDGFAPGNGDMLVGGGTDARSVPLPRLIQWLRDYDAQQAGINHQFVE